VAGSVVLVAFFWLLRVWLISNVLPGIIKTQLSGVLKREISFAKIETRSFPAVFVAFDDLKVARGATFDTGILASCDRVDLQFDFRRLILGPMTIHRAIKRATVIRPVVALDIADIRAAMLAYRGADKPVRLPPLPKGLFMLKDGILKLTEGSNLILKVDNVNSALDLRDLPLIQGRLRFTVIPDAAVDFDARCHMGLRYYDGSLETDRLDLDKCASVLRETGPLVPKILA